MSDSVALNHAARVLAAISPELRADAALRSYMAEHRRLTAVERRAISRMIFSYYRWLGWLDRGTSPQVALQQAAEWQARFTRDPKYIKPAALAARAVPAWLVTEMEVSTSLLVQLQREPTLWLRARRRDVAAVADFLGQCENSRRVPEALRYIGQQDLFLTAPFQEGRFEIQDLASQFVGRAAAPRPGETWWDACAGEGGKTLHLADQMENRGLIWASDRSARRLDTLKRRAARAQVYNYRVAPWDGGARLPTKTKFDGILVDAPCSGVGTWQRNPQARWTTQPADVAELAATQLSLLGHVAGALKPGGRLIYSVCTLTRRETDDVATAFSQAHPEFVPYPISGYGERVTLRPEEWDANGMFIAAWQRKK